MMHKHNSIIIYKVKERIKSFVLSFFHDNDLLQEMEYRYTTERHIGRQELEKAKVEMEAYIDSIGGKKVFAEKCSAFPLPLAETIDYRSFGRQEYPKVDCIFQGK